jgi:hypothetical protein
MSRPGPYLRGARAGVPVGVSIFAVGLAFGVFARDLGWGLFAPTVMSLAVFSGSAQLVAATGSPRPSSVHSTAEAGTIIRLDIGGRLRGKRLHYAGPTSCSRSVSISNS